MKLIPRESGYLYAVPDGNFDVTAIQLYVDGDGYSISFNNGAQRKFEQGMKIPSKYHTAKYLIVTLHKEGKRYDSDSLPMTLITLVGGPVENLFPKVIADLIYRHKELAEKYVKLEARVKEIEDDGEFFKEEV